jgi:hypothetical protein
MKIDSNRRVSRRAVLAAMGAVGATATGAGMGAAAYLSDQERFRSSLTAGSLDLRLDYRATYNGEVTGQAPPDREWREVGTGALDCDVGGLVDGDGVPVVELADVKPGDCGSVTASLHVCANPSRLWMAVDLVETAEATRRPEEVLAGDQSDDVGELQDLVDVTLWLDDDCDGVADADETVLFEGTLAELAAFARGGVPLGRDPATDVPVCVDPGVVCVGLSWCVPLDGVDHNRAATDSVAFDLRFAAVQCRHDAMGDNPFADVSTPEAPVEAPTVEEPVNETEPSG